MIKKYKIKRLKIVINKISCEIWIISNESKVCIIEISIFKFTSKI